MRNTHKRSKRRKRKPISDKSAAPKVNLTELRLHCVLSAWTGEPGKCEWCNKIIPVGSRRKVYCSTACNRAFEREHVWSRARATARRKARYRCAVAGCNASRSELEVNHINPRNGAGYGVSCGHHVNELEVLCHTHHVEITAKQRAEGLITRKKFDRPESL